MSTAERSCDITFVNSSDVALTYDSLDLRGGIWSPRFLRPPPRIEPHTTVTWGTESDGFLTGTEAVMYYRIELPGGFHGGYIMLWWNIPWEGSRKYDQQSPPAYKWALTGELNNKNAVIQWEFMEASTTGDGISDDWKLNGVTRDGQFINLPAMGATVDRPNIFMQIDWMEDSTTSHRISDNALRLVVESFARSPFISRSGSVGINLIIDHGPNSIMIYGQNGAPDTLWGDLSQARALPRQTNLGTGDYDWNEFDSIKNEEGGFTKSGRSLIFRYMISCDHLSATMSSPNASGNARRGAYFDSGSDFIVAHGAITNPTDIRVGGTLMHELGHILGLNHGGGQDDKFNWKPNYLSVMNYHFQFSGLTRAQVLTPGSAPVPVAGIIDFSREELPRLQEDALNENDGIGHTAAVGLGTVRFDASLGVFVPVVDGSQSIDWDNNGVIDTNNVTYNIRHDGNPTGPPPEGELKGWNDWLVIRLKGGLVGRAGGPGSAIRLPGSAQGSETHNVDEITNNRLPDDITPPITTFTLSPTPNENGWNNSPVTITLSATDDITGVARTEISLDSGGTWNPYTAPVTVFTEGTTTFSFYSTDRAGNVEVTQTHTVNLDMTPPSAQLEYEPRSHRLILRTVDTLSGEAITGPLTPELTVDPVYWTENGSDPGVEQMYVLFDRADNHTVIWLHVREEGDEFEVQVLGEHRSCKDHGKKKGKVRRNTVIYRRQRGWDLKDRPLLGVTEQIALGNLKNREVVRRTWDVLHDDTELLKWKEVLRGDSVKGPRKDGRVGCSLLIGPRYELKVGGL